MRAGSSARPARRAPRPLHSAEAAAGTQPTVTMVYTRKELIESASTPSPRTGTARRTGAAPRGARHRRLGTDLERRDRGVPRDARGGPRGPVEAVRHAAARPTPWFSSAAGPPLTMDLRGRRRGPPDRTSRPPTPRAARSPRSGSPSRTTDGKNTGTDKIDVLALGGGGLEAMTRAPRVPPDRHLRGREPARGRRPPQLDRTPIHRPRRRRPRTRCPASHLPRGRARPLTAPPDAHPLPAVALAPERSRARAGRTVALTRRLVSADPACAGPGEYVEIRRRRRRRTDFARLRLVSTAADGTFTLPLRADATAGYVAVAPERPGCLSATSAGASLAAVPRASRLRRCLRRAHRIRAPRARTRAVRRCRLGR